METKVFEAYSRYYDLLYADKPYHLEADHIHNKLVTINPNVRTIVEFGAGTGKHARLLADKGLHLSGIERSEVMLEQALVLARQSPPYSVVQGDVRSTCIGNQFDAVISLFHVISYQTSNADVLATFRNASKHLSLGGIFFFDVWYTPAVLFQRPVVRVKKLQDATIIVTRLAEPSLHSERNVVEVNYTVFIENKKSQQISTISERHFMRHFSIPEIDMFSTVAGFKIISCEEFLTSNSPSENSWSVAFALRKEREL